MVVKIICMAVGRVMGAPQVEISAAALISDRTLRTYSEKYAEPISEIEKAIKPLLKINRREIKHMVADQTEKQLEDLLGTAIQAIQDALTDGDTQTAADNAWKLLHQLRGKPTSTVNLNQSGTTRHIHEHFVMPASLVAAFAADVIRDAPLIDRARQIEAGSRGVTAERVIDVVPS